MQLFGEGRADVNLQDYFSSRVCTYSKSHGILSSIEGKVNFEIILQGYLKMAEEAFIPPPEKISSVSSAALHGTNHHQIKFLKLFLTVYFFKF